jgi:hypothetical protein
MLTKQTSTALAAILLLTSAVATRAQSAPAPAWSGAGSRRLLVRVAARDLHGRSSDRMPARIKIEEPLDPGSLSVVRYNAATGKALPGNVAFRFDDSPPTDFFLHYWPGDGMRGGTLVWQHEQDGSAASYYGVYFNPPAAKRDPQSVAPRGWIGDGDAKYRRTGPLPSALLVRPIGFDWDNDGLTDIIVADELGYVSLYRNIGTRTQPMFGLGEPLRVDGRPIDVPYMAAAAIGDWNGDGLPDLLVGQEPKGVIHYFQNVGTRSEPKLTDRGTLQADGQEISPPHEPVPEEPPGVFKDNYGSIPAIVDWNGDGKLSLLAGTYITGQMYLYQNAGTNPDGTPKLHYAAPVNADGKEIDVGWNATPTIADIDGDGQWDLISGSMIISTETGGDRPELATLHFYKRSGNSLHEVMFPFDDGGAAFQRLKAEETKILFPTANHGGAPYSTGIADMNSDGLVDLLVGSNEGQVFYFVNVGNRINPRFRLSGSLTGTWVPDLWGFDSIVDFYGDGKYSALQGGNGIRTLLLPGPSFKEPIELKTASGKAIGKRAEHGDDFGSARFYDFDRDGKPDIVFGAVDGSVWLYRNIGTRSQPKFADGEEFKMTDGSALVAGIPRGTKVTDFTVLQGNRAIPAAADFNGDGKTDLIVGTATSQIFYFENTTDNRNPRFAPARQLDKRTGRIDLTTADWDGDGLPDIIFSCSGPCSGDAGASLFLMRHVPDRTRTEFLSAQPFPTQTLIPSGIAAVVDWDHDGDTDIVISCSYGVIYWLDGSFIRQGYPEAEIVRTENRDALARRGSENCMQGGICFTPH